MQNCTEALKISWDLPLLNVGRDEQRAFFDLWWPIRFRAVERLENAVLSGTARNGVEPTVFRQLAECLLNRLYCSMGEQVLWTKFSAELSPGTILMAHLCASGDANGRPARKRYKAFIERHRRDGLQALFRMNFPCWPDLSARFPHFGFRAA